MTILAPPKLEKKVLDDLFKELFERKDICIYGSCHANVPKLFNELSKGLAGLQPSQFKVLFIASKAQIETPSEEAGFYVRKSRETYKNGVPGVFDWFKYHVVLEYEGRIYDLDFTDKASPVNKAEYFDEFFIDEELITKNPAVAQSTPKHLFVFSIPGENYLHEKNDLLESSSFHQKIFEDYESVPISEYFGSRRKMTPK